MTKNTILEEIDNIKTQLIEKYKPAKIILFGSFIWGEGEINDIDLLIIKSDTPYYGIDRMRELDKIIKRNMAVDMLVYKPEEIKERLEMGDPFLKKIFSEGKIIYG
ncbi:MAG: nucleotidyltransferase domain-containing protein [Candidatus Firestonebacteria bacterium]|nr:nucleotidyltransferase domain-containing protein [Candidatus Firestonebacteria bacterium]